MLREKQTHWTRKGLPKEPFPSYEAAAAHAEKLLHDDWETGRLMTFPHAYQCAECALWHVGNTH